jgi:hypothetical protein
MITNSARWFASAAAEGSSHENHYVSAGARDDPGAVHRGASRSRSPRDSSHPSTRGGAIGPLLGARLQYRSAVSIPASRRPGRHQSKCKTDSAKRRGFRGNWRKWLVSGACAFILKTVDLPRRLSPHWNAVRIPARPRFFRFEPSAINGDLLKVAATIPASTCAGRDHAAPSHPTRPAPPYGTKKPPTAGGGGGKFVGRATGP